MPHTLPAPPSSNYKDHNPSTIGTLPGPHVLYILAPHSRKKGPLLEQYTTSTGIANAKCFAAGKIPNIHYQSLAKGMDAGDRQDPGRMQL